MINFSTPLEGALFIAKNMGGVFPLGAGAKKPPTGSKGLREAATTEKDKILKWSKEYPNCNWGFHPCTGDMTVIDLDNHEGKDGKKKDGRAELEKLAKSFGQTVPATFTVRTPSGGLHLYFKNALPNSTDDFLPGVDVHSKGKYAVAPGSRTKQGSYQVIDDREPAVLPEWFAKAYADRKATSGVGQRKETASPLNTLVVPDSESNISLAVGIMSRWSETMEGGRNVQLHQMMREVCKAGVTPAKAEELYYQFGIDRLHYGYDDAEKKEVHSTILSAYGDMSDFGSNSFEAVTHNLQAEEDDEPENWNDLGRASVPPREWLIQDWLAADQGSVTLFAGQGGTGKSLLSLMLAHSLATGEPWLGMPVTHRARSLVVTCEDSRDEVARRIQRIEAASGRHVKDGLIKVWSRQGKVNLLAFQGVGGAVAAAPFFPKLKEACVKHFGSEGGVLILDTLADFASINENDRAQVSQFIKTYLANLASEAGASIVLLGHPNKTNRGYSGSTAWEGSVRSRWELMWRDKDKDGNEIVGGPLTLRLAKSNGTMAGKEITLTYGDNYLPNACAEAKEDTTIRDSLLKLIEEAEQKGRPYGSAPNSPKSIFKVKLKDPFLDRDVDESVIRKALDELYALDLVEVVTESRVRVLKTIKNA